MAKKTTLNALWLGEKVGTMTEKLSQSGNDADVIVIGLSARGDVRILWDGVDIFKVYGILAVSAGNIYDLISQYSKGEIE